MKVRWRPSFPTDMALRALTPEVPGRIPSPGTRHDLPPVHVVDGWHIDRLRLDSWVDPPAAREPETPGYCRSYAYRAARVNNSLNSCQSPSCSSESRRRSPFTVTLRPARRR